MIKTFFILWFMISSNSHTLNVVKFDTEAECQASLKAIETTFNELYWVDLDKSYSRCIKVEVKE